MRERIETIGLSALGGLLAGGTLLAVFASFQFSNSSVGPGDFLSFAGSLVGVIGAVAVAYSIERHRDWKADERIKRAVVDLLLQLEVHLKFDDVIVEKVEDHWARVHADGVELSLLIGRFRNPTIEQFSYLRTIVRWLDEIDFTIGFRQVDFEADLARNIIQKIADSEIAPLLAKARGVLPAPYLVSPKKDG